MADLARANRAVSPSESVASNTYGKAADPGPRTARQIAAAAAKQRAAQKAAEESDDDSDHDELRRTTTTTATKAQPMQVTESTDSLAPGGGALGIDIGTSREGSAGKTAAAAPAPPPPAKRAARGTKRQRGEEDDEEDEDDLEEEERPAKRTGTAVAKKAAAATTTTTAVAAAVTPVDDFDTGDADTTGGDNEVDSKVYCTCRQFSYGEVRPGRRGVRLFSMLTAALPIAHYFSGYFPVIRISPANSRQLCSTFQLNSLSVLDTHILAIR